MINHRHYEFIGNKWLTMKSENKKSDSFIFQSASQKQQKSQFSLSLSTLIKAY